MACALRGCGRRTSEQGFFWMLTSSLVWCIIMISPVTGYRIETFWQPKWKYFIYLLLQGQNMVSIQVKCWQMTSYLVIISIQNYFNTQKKLKCICDFKIHLYVCKSVEPEQNYRSWRSKTILRWLEGSYFPLA